MGAKSMDQARVIFKAARSLHVRIMGRNAKFKVLESELCCGLTMPQVNMLSVIRTSDGISIKDLANALQVSPPSASAMVDRLVEMTIVTREQNPADRREVVIRVSPRAAELLGGIEEEVLAVLVDYIEKLGPEYAEKWCDVYSRLLEILVEEKG